MIVCPQCGAQNLPGMAYCEHCGSPLAVPEQEPAAVASGDHSADAAIAQAQAVLDELGAGGPAPQEAAPAQPQQAAAPAPAAMAAQAPAAPPPAQDLPEAAPPLDAAPATPGSVGALVFTFPNGAEFEVTTERANVGRSDVAQGWHPELDVIPFGGGAPDLGVSRHQALIQRIGSGYTIVDVGSTNGTFVNGKPLEYNAPVDLQDGDTVAFGAFNTKISIR